MAAAALLAAKFSPVSLACTVSVDALTLDGETIRAEKRNVRGVPLASASASQHKRPTPPTAPGARVTRSCLGTVAHTVGFTPGTGLITPIVTTKPTMCPGVATGWMGTIRTLAAVWRDVTVAMVFAESLA